MIDNFISQESYEKICENLRVSSYLDFDDELDDKRIYSLGEILEMITQKIKED